MITSLIVHGLCAVIIAAGLASVAYGLFKKPGRSDRVLIGSDRGQSDRLGDSLEGLGAPLELEMHASETLDRTDDSILDRSRR